MPSYRALSLRPVKTLKHEITWSLLGLDASTNQTIDLVEGTESPVGATQISIGGIVKGIYIEFNLNGVDNSGVVQVFHWQVIKVPAGLTVAVANAYQSDQKKFIMKRGMEMLPEIPLGSGGTVQTKRIFFVKLPPRYRRFDDGDKLQLKFISTSASGINFCGIGIFKEWR